MISISGISKSFSRIYGFMKWNWKHKFQSDFSKSNPKVQLLLQSIKEANHKQFLPEIELIRHKLINREINFQEHLFDINNQQEIKNKIAKHARSSASPQLNAIILRAIIEKIDISYVLELGTSVGISSAYMGYKQSTIVDTIDLDVDLSIAAEYWHNKIGFTNINYFRGSFDLCLPTILTKDKKYDLIFIDGDHSYDGTICNFFKILAHCSSEAILIIDDIYWSWGMQKAWNEIKQNTAVKFSIDLYHFGIIHLGHMDDKLTDYYQIPDLYLDWFLRKNG